ncbi:unnamed protein product, partial [marine sediment metagenome]
QEELLALDKQYKQAQKERVAYTEEHQRVLGLVTYYINHYGSSGRGVYQSLETALLFALRSSRGGDGSHCQRALELWNAFKYTIVDFPNEILQKELEQKEETEDINQYVSIWRHRIRLACAGKPMTFAKTVLRLAALLFASANAIAARQVLDDGAALALLYIESAKSVSDLQSKELEELKLVWKKQQEQDEKKHAEADALIEERLKGKTDAEKLKVKQVQELWRKTEVEKKQAQFEVVLRDRAIKQRQQKT